MPGPVGGWMGTHLESQRNERNISNWERKLEAHELMQIEVFNNLIYKENLVRLNFKYRKILGGNYTHSFVLVY